LVNINIEVPDDVHKELKVKCAIEDSTIKDFIIKALEEEVVNFEKEN